MLDILQARDGNAQLEEQYRDELIAQEKLIELYKVATYLSLDLQVYICKKTLYE